ncbi:delta-60 repeat domain-containing protein [Streptomyces sp. NBC_01525]|uniref:delta-60 repeat domain-containing protein n=1 Tax=Streptomyces sp. NBC_01525 TaxID=2903893 RepID=UPI00386DA310
MTAGDLDPSFGTGGKVSIDFGAISIANAVALQSDAKLVLAGRVDDVSTGDFGVARLNRNGGLDTTFGTSGKVVLCLSAAEDVAPAVALQSDGKIVAGGFIGETTGLASFTDPVAGDFAVYRLNANGTPDTTFGIGGAVRTDFAGLGDGGRAVTLRTANRIVQVGGATTNHLNFAAARYKT